jgi:pimeloyl-ACP methyl ester carboxylesterase
MNAAILSRRDEIDAAEEREMEPLARHRLADLQVPVLVVVGELDQPDALASADALIAGIPGARRASVPDAAHLPSMERVDPYNRIVRDFLESL